MRAKSDLLKEIKASNLKTGRSVDRLFFCVDLVTTQDSALYLTGSNGRLSLPSVPPPYRLTKLYASLAITPMPNARYVPKLIASIRSSATAIY